LASHASGIACAGERTKIVIASAATREHDEAPPEERVQVHRQRRAGEERVIDPEQPRRERAEEADLQLRVRPPRHEPGRGEGLAVGVVDEVVEVPARSLAREAALEHRLVEVIVEDEFRRDRREMDDDREDREERREEPAGCALDPHRPPGRGARRNAVPHDGPGDGILRATHRSA
jgi:hypothetical protein